MSWKSLSNNGRGILVKVNGLTVDNFKSSYLSIAKELNIELIWGEMARNELADKQHRQKLSVTLNHSQLKTGVRMS